MKRNDVVPLSLSARRMPEAGRIRIGMQVKSRNGKMRPDKLETFRFTSPYRDVIEQLAALYGGTPEPWNEPKARIQNQFQVLSSSNEMEVYLPPDGLSQWYELWPGPQRRCDGVTVEIPQEVNDDDYELITAPCICNAQQDRKCDVHTRLTVLIPQVAMRGSWRLETKSWNAKAEMPGVFDMIAALGGQGQYVQAVLSVQKRSGRTPTGKTRHYVVPELSIKQSLRELQTGQASAAAAVTAGGTGQRELGPLGLNRGAPMEPGDPMDTHTEPSFDHEVIDAEVVSDEEEAVRAKLRADATQFGLDGDRFLASLYRAIGATGVLDEQQLARLENLHGRITREEVAPLGFKPDGSIQWGQ